MFNSFWYGNYLVLLLVLFSLSSSLIEASRWSFWRGGSDEDNSSPSSSSSNNINGIPPFDQDFIDVLKTTEDLSLKVFDENPIGGTEYDEFFFYAEQLDQAIVARRQGKCYASFRGTAAGWPDWWQNVQPGRTRLCATSAMSVEESTDWTEAWTRDCCTVRLGYYKAYNETYRSDMELALRNCAASCSDPNHCVYLTGHSQGAAIAAVAAIVLHDLNPWVVGWEPPKAVYDPASRVITGRNCPLMDSGRWIRFLNSAVEPMDLSQTPTLWYDAVPQLWSYGAEAYGHLILMGEDVSGMVYLGLDNRDTFQPFDFGTKGTHGDCFRNFDSIVSYYETNSSVSFPIRLSGYIQGTPCSKHKECQSQQCQSRLGDNNLKYCS